MFVLRPLAHRRIALLWGGQVLSAVGDEVYKVALIWLAVGLVGERAGYLASVEAASVLVFGLIGGIWADRWEHRKTMIAVDVVRSLTVLAVPLIAHFRPLTLWQLVPVAIVVSSLSALFDPALQEALPELAPDRESLQATNGLLEATRRLARIIGPGIVGAFGGFIPLIHFFTIDAVSFAASAISVAGIRMPLPPSPPALASVPAAKLRESLLGGWRAVREVPLLRFALLAAALTWATWSLIFTLGLALHLHNHFPDQIGAYGLVVASYGVGNLASNLVMGSIRVSKPGRIMFLGVLIVGVGFFFMALAPRLPYMMLAAAFAAIGGPMDDLSFLQVLQSGFQGKMIARIFRLRMAISFGAILVIFLLSPSLFHQFGIPNVMAVCAAIMAIVGTIGLFRFG